MTIFVGSPQSSLYREFTVFSHVKCMPDGNNFIIRRCDVDWRDFAFFMKTDWGDLKTNYKIELD